MAAVADKGEDFLIDVGKGRREAPCRDWHGTRHPAAFVCVAPGIVTTGHRVSRTSATSETWHANEGSTTYTYGGGTGQMAIQP